MPPTWSEFVAWATLQAAQASGRPALRRRWVGLRALANQVKDQIGPEEVRRLLGKDFSQLDPEHNDLKALVAYAAGKGILPDAAVLQTALRDDADADPLYFLAAHSGKTFGEKYAPMFAEFWLSQGSDEWSKKKSSDLYDVGWTPSELGGREIRIELKASSEQPKYLFQQIRHPKMSGGEAPDYDLLLCVGVSAAALEWWAIPASRFDDFADNGATADATAVITRHHGKRRPIWNVEHGFADEGWFRADPNARKALQRFSCEHSQELRAMLLAMFQD
jgi:hypothetical protein